MATAFKQGNEYLYRPNSHVEPIWLTYVRKTTDCHVLFSSQFPTVDYHVDESTLQTGSVKDFPLPQINEEYRVFNGKDQAKEKAYRILAERRGIEVETIISLSISHHPEMEPN